MADGVIVPLHAWYVRHKAGLDWGSNKYKGVCHCGWESGWMAREEDAAAAAQTHVRNSLAGSPTGPAGMGRAGHPSTGRNRNL